MSGEDDEFVLVVNSKRKGSMQRKNVKKTGTACATNIPLFYKAVAPSKHAQRGQAGLDTKQDHINRIIQLKEGMKRSSFFSDVLDVCKQQGLHVVGLVDHADTLPQATSSNATSEVNLTVGDPVIADCDRPCRSTADCDRPCRSTADCDRPCRSTADCDRPCRSTADCDRPCRSTADSDRPCRSTTESGSNERHAEQACVHDIVCYGVGPFAHSLVARHQLALALLLRDALEIKGRFYFFDPVLSNEEIEIAEELGGTAVRENEQGKRAFTVTTLVYMPHCGRRLYDNVLRANWGMPLANLFVLGNSFTAYYEKLYSHEVSVSTSPVILLRSFYRERACRDSHDVVGVFNDHSLHTFPRAILEGTDQGLWERPPPEPEGADSELITS